MENLPSSSTSTYTCKYREECTTIDNDDDIQYFFTDKLNNKPDLPKYFCFTNNFNLCHFLDFLHLVYTRDISAQNTPFEVNFGLGMRICNPFLYGEIWYTWMNPLMTLQDVPLINESSPYPKTRLIYPNENTPISIVFPPFATPVYIPEYSNSYFARIRLGKFISIENTNFIRRYTNPHQLHETEISNGVTSTSLHRLCNTFYLDNEGFKPTVDEKNMAYQLRIPENIDFNIGEKKTVFLKIKISLPTDSYGKLFISPKFENQLTIPQSYCDDTENIFFHDEIIGQVKNVSNTNLSLKYGEKIFHLKIYKHPTFVNKADFFNTVDD